MTAVRVCVLTRDKFREIGLREILAKDPEIAFLETTRAQDELETVARLLPDVVVLDGANGPLDLPAYLLACKKASPQTNFLLIGTDSNEDVVGAFRAGIKGYLNILNCADEIVTAVKTVHRGNAWIARRTIGRLIDEVAFELAKGGRPARESLVTPNQRKVLELLAREGLTNKEIAAQLQIEERTVEFHISSLLRKFLLANRNQLIIYAIRQGLVDLGEPPAWRHGSTS